jgi:predicted ester cyclase
VTPDLLYLRFAELFNARDYPRLGEVLTEDFVDHHPGLVDVASLPEYRRNLAAVTAALDMYAAPREVVPAGDRVFTRVLLTGRHVGEFLGLAPTGNPLSWYTHELWRVRAGRLAERWAVDDLFTLTAQIGVPQPAWTRRAA